MRQRYPSHATSIQSLNQQHHRRRQVGYGDITVATALGRFWVCCLICVSFIWLPYEINRLTQMLHLRSRFLTSFAPRADRYEGEPETHHIVHPSSKDPNTSLIFPCRFKTTIIDRPNVLLVGHLEPGKLSTFLTEFFHPDRRTDVNQAAFYHVRVCIYDSGVVCGGEGSRDPTLRFSLTHTAKSIQVVILDNEEPSDEVRVIHKRRVGSVLLRRCPICLVGHD